jgi:2,4-dienoyl-CoA reductase-like NADH-dependent reductase (Old Yellow Enzyme family)
LVVQDYHSEAPFLQRPNSPRFGLWKDEQIEKMQQINRFIIVKTVPGIQLAHAGKASAAYHGKAKETLIMVGKLWRQAQLDTMI